MRRAKALLNFCSFANLVMTIAAMISLTGCGGAAEEDESESIAAPSPVSPVKVTTPTAAVTSNASSLTISGDCLANATVVLSGSASDSAPCTGQRFSFDIPKTSDGSFTFSIRQSLNATRISAPATVTWTRDTVSPAAPTVATPSISPVYQRTNSLTITGACETAALVELSGDATGSTVCTSGAYSLNFTKTTDGSYSVQLKQTDTAGNSSVTRSIILVRDTVKPNQVTLTSPASNPFNSGDSTLTIGGACELGATVNLSGAATNSTTCSAEGTFSFTTSKISDSTYNYSLTQTDLSGNTSDPLAFQWIRDASIPSTPVITAPATNPYYSNLSSLTITSTCQTGLSPAAELNIYGDLDTALTQTCESSPESFVVNKSTDGTYTFFVDQSNPSTEMVSAAASLTWIRDTIAPSAPTIVNPGVSPFTAPGNLLISGACEANATVNLSGSDTQSTACSITGTYAFTVVKSTDATYTFSLRQTDRAGNQSSASTLSWVRDSNSVAPPVITNPAVNPLINNSSTITISGTCTNGYEVILSGTVTSSEVSTPANTLTQTCTANTFSFVVGKSLDGNYSFYLKQRFNAVDSALVNLGWTRDSVAPTTTLSVVPPVVSFSVDASFSFSADETGSTFLCSLDGSAFSSCTSPVTYLALQNGSHKLEVRSVDAAGNTGAIAVHNWTQAAYNTFALYHLNDGSETVDDSKFTSIGGFNNNLSATGSPSNYSFGRYPTSAPSSRTFSSGSFYSAASNDSLTLGSQTMTIEGFVRAKSITTRNDFYTLVSKSGNGSSAGRGWEVRLKKANSTKYVLEFVASLDGVNQTPVISNTFGFTQDTWYYFAVTWNRGSVNFWFGNSSATARGSKSIGTIGSAAIATTEAPLRLAAGPSTGTGTSLFLNGQLDEVRCSQVVRKITFPTGEFVAD